jgi:CubicO group peptidase (beta-lactamase class C family)
MKILPSLFVLVTFFLFEKTEARRSLGPNDRERYENMSQDLSGEFGNDLSIEEEIENQQVNAVSIAIIERSRITQYRQYGYRDKEKMLPADKETTFHVASLSKLLAGMAMAEAERQGFVDRDKSVKSYAEIFPHSYLDKWVRKKFNRVTKEYPEEINLRRLMSHTAGLDTHAIGIQSPKFLKTMESIILGNPIDPRKKGVRPIHSPGTIYDYSGGGYVVGEHLLELTTGMSYKDWVSENILAKVGMNHSTLEMANDRMIDLANGCSRGLCKGKQKRTKVKSAGGLIATAEDYAKLLIALTNNGYIGFQSVLEKSVIEKVLQAQPHRESSFHQCLRSNQCPQTRRLCLSPFGGCAEVPFEQVCYQNKCQQIIETSSGSWYGQGVFMSGELMSNGDRRILTHTGSNDENETTFYFDRVQNKGIVILVAGSVWSHRGTSRGARVINDEILASFKKHYLGH